MSWWSAALKLDSTGCAWMTSTFMRLPPISCTDRRYSPGPLQSLEQKRLPGSIIVFGVFPGDHLPRIEQSLWIRLALECELHLVGLLHAALFQRVAMRIEDRATI